MNNFKEGDQVKFKIRPGYGGSNPYFYGEIKKHGNKLKIEGDDYEDSFNIDDPYLTEIHKI